MKEVVYIFSLAGAGLLVCAGVCRLQAVAGECCVDSLSTTIPTKLLLLRGRTDAELRWVLELWTLGPELSRVM